MTLSPRGIAQAARPFLGRAKRAAVLRGSQLSVSGTPSPELATPEHAWEASRRFWAGVALDLAGRTDAAISQFSVSVELDERFGKRWLRLANALRSEGRLDEAADAYRTASELLRNDAEAMSWVAVLTLRDQLSLSTDTTASDAARQLLARRVPRDPQSTFLFGLLCEAAGDDDEARSLYADSLCAEPSNADRQLRFARFEAGHERWESAADAYRQATVDDETFSEDPPPTPDQLRLELGEDQPVGDWAAVAALSRARVDLDPGDADAHRALGLALFEMQQWTDARRSIQVAAATFPTDIFLLERLATAAARCGDHAGAASTRQQCVVLSPTASRFHRLAIDLQHAGRAEEAAIAFEHAIRLGAPRRDFFDRFGATLRRTADWAGAVVLYRSAVDRDPDDGHLRYFLGFALEHVGEPEDARVQYERAVELDPSNPQWRFRLGYLHERFGSTRTVVQSRTGLERREAGDLARAAEHYRIALDLDPERLGFWKRLGGVEETLGNLEASRLAYQRVVDLAPDDANSWHLLGRTISAAATRRGMYHTEEHDELERIWGRSIELAPHLSGSRNQLTRASIKAARWPLADDLAWFPMPAVSSAGTEAVLRGYLSGVHQSIEDVEAELGRPNEDLMWIPREWWFPLHWRLLTDNHFTAAYRAKSLMAERIVSDGIGRPDDNLAGYLEHARALTFLERHEQAIEALTPSATAALALRTRQTLERQAADVSLLTGDVSAHLQLMHTDLEPHVEIAERRFRELIENRSVAIVGPGLSEERHGPEIDSHDVVIRTKFTRQQLSDYAAIAGSRTDISYYALGSARFLRDDITDALASEDLQMAVFRTATYTATPPHLVRPGDVRYVPSEFTAGFRASQFAIQRIFYDVLRYRPAAVKIFNIDFFLSPDAYRPGYLAEYAKKAEEKGFVKVLGAFGHDFLADFRFTRAMAGFGLLTGDERVRQILELSPAEYLAGLDRRR